MGPRDSHNFMSINNNKKALSFKDNHFDAEKALFKATELLFI